ncbi:MAG: agmatine deiminase family protein [Bacteroidales bacterium]|nr:agmatine deiminase family protein [Bacteroidales bacterium]
MRYFYFLLIILILSNKISFSQEYYISPKGLTHHLNEKEKQLLKEKGIIYAETNPPVAPVRNIAEFEPTEAVIIAYDGGFGIPYTVIKELAKDVKVIIIVANQSEANSVKNTLQTNSVNTANCLFLIAPVDSWWTRDYSGWFVADGNNKVAVIDFPYNRPRPNDDAIPSKEAQFLNTSIYEMGVIHTGGNYMTDGMGIAVSTELVLEENPSLSQIQINQKMHDFLGIDNYIIYNDPMGEYIKHVDCWGKFLAVDKILIGQVPTSDTNYYKYEAAATYFSNTNCSYGYKYKVFRTYSPNKEPYTNSFICNNKVFVAIKGDAYDNDALNVYKNALPGYTVTGYTSSGSQQWYNTDALHCRVHEIADRKMLYINHIPLYDTLCSDSGYYINTKIISYGGRSLKANFPIVKYKTNSGQWDSLIMTKLDSVSYKAIIPIQTAGSNIYYYIKAEDDSGKIAFHPFIGQDAPHLFIVCNQTGFKNAKTKPDVYLNVFPNPSNGNFYIYMNSEKTCIAKIKISNLTGQIIYSGNFNVNSGMNLLNIKPDNISKGIYLLKLQTSSLVTERTIVIQ